MVKTRFSIEDFPRFVKLDAALFFHYLLPMDIEEHYEAAYRKTLEEVLESLEAKQRDTGFSAGEARKVLESLYVSQGNNWVGRGSLAALSMEATIAAYEQFIAQEEEKG